MKRGIMTSCDVDITSLFPNSRHLGSAILDFGIFPKRQKTVKHDSKVNKTNKMIKKGQSYCQKVIFFLKEKHENAKFGKTFLSKYGCHGNSKLHGQ